MTGGGGTWPAFLSEQDLRDLRHRLRVQKSVGGTRVRLFADDAAAEYVRLTTGAFQLAERGDVPKFPTALAARDLTSNASPYAVVATPTRVELVEAASGRRAIYVPSGGAWRKLLER